MAASPVAGARIEPPEPAGGELGARLDEVFDQPLATTQDELLSIRGLSVRFGGLRALTRVDLDVGRHDLVAIIGPNGAGKTTTLNAICQLIRCSGSITFAGRPIDTLPAWKVAAAGIGRSFQDPPLIDHYSVLENVLCGAHLRLRYGMLGQLLWRRAVRSQEDGAVRRAMALLEFVGLVGHAHEEAGSLSFGARKLVDIVRAMVSGPRLLLLDEPSSGLDEHERNALRSVLLALRQERRVGILAVEHHMDLVRATATHVIALQAGEVLMAGTPAEVLDSARFRVAVVGGRAGTEPPSGERAGAPDGPGEGGS
jgi:branched-chain amino acid transport system ATP-binding protein